MKSIQWPTAAKTQCTIPTLPDACFRFKSSRTLAYKCWGRRGGTGLETARLSRRQRQLPNGTISEEMNQRGS